MGSSWCQQGMCSRTSCRDSNCAAMHDMEPQFSLLQVVVQPSKHKPPQRIPRPTTAFFKGSIAGAPGSSVLLSVGENGAVHGVAHRDNASFALTRSPRATAGSGPVAAAAALAAAPLSSSRTTSAQTRELPRFSCGVQRKPALSGRPQAAAASAAGSRRLKQVLALGWKLQANEVQSSWLGAPTDCSQHLGTCALALCPCGIHSDPSAACAAAVGG